MNTHPIALDVYDRMVEKQLRLRFSDVTIESLGDFRGDLKAALKNDKFMVVERKTPTDFVNSMTAKTNQHLFTQAETIGKLPDTFAFVIVDGVFQYRNDHLLMTRPGVGLVESGWERVNIEGAKRKLIWLGCVVQETTDYARQIELNIKACEEYDKPIQRSQPIRSNDYDDDYQKAIDMLSVFPNIGAVRAKNFVDWYGGHRRRIEILVRALSRFGIKDHPRGWSDDTVIGLREWLQVRPNEVLQLTEKPEWFEELDEQTDQQ